MISSDPDNFWFPRHYVALSTAATFIIALSSPSSLNARALDAAGPLGPWVLAGLLALSLVVFAESFVHSFLPWFRWAWLRRHRHTLLMLVALGQLSNAYIVTVYAPDSAALAIRFVLDAAAATWLAYLDLFLRHQVEARGR